MNERGPREDDRPSSDLLEAIEEAARSVGSSPAKAEAVPIRLRFDAERVRRPVMFIAAVVLLLGLAGGSFLSLRSHREPPPPQVEADLRWAVAQVVRRVEALRSQTGRLPTAQDLRGLVSDLVVYEPLAEGYWVYGRRGEVRVEFDGSVPLDRWLLLQNH